MAFDPILCADVRRIIMRALFAFYRRRAVERNLPPGPTGAIAMQQRFGSALNLNIHLHILVVDGVFDPTDSETRAEFHFTGNPSPADIARLLATVRHRIERLLERRGLNPAGEDPTNDPAEHDPELAACLQQAALDRQRSRRNDGNKRVRPKTMSPDRLLAREGGYSLHADTAIPGFDAPRRGMLVRYVLRPPFAPSQVELTRDGRVSFRLSRPFDDGTSHFMWKRDAFLARLAALIPRPRRHLITYHGVFAPNHRLRSRVVRTPNSETTTSSRRCAREKRSPPRRRASHEVLLLRAYGFFFRRCDRCGGQKRILAVIQRPDVVNKILRALGLDPEPPQRAPPRAETTSWDFA